MCRRELDKAESEIRKNSSIIGDYKQVSLGSRVGQCHRRPRRCSPPAAPGPSLALSHDPERCSESRGATGGEQETLLLRTWWGPSTQQVLP